MEKTPEPIQSSPWIRVFDENTPIDAELLGNKGANLAKMTRLDLPVPAGFTLTVEAWKKFTQTQVLPDKIWQAVLTQLKNLEEKTGKNFGKSDNPLLVSVRSGAYESMPGMMETVLNVGLTKKTIKGLANQIGHQTAKNCYRRLTNQFKDLDKLPLPENAHQQLKSAIELVFRSWDNPRAKAYKEQQQVSDQIGTAATIQQQVFGNAGENSGSGVWFTRNPKTGAPQGWGEFVKRSQGDVIVGGRGKPDRLPPKIAEQLQKFGNQLEKYFRASQDIEFTVEQGTIWLLQSRNIKGTPLAKIRLATDLLNEGLIQPEEAFRRVGPGEINYLLNPGFDSETKNNANLITTGIPASIGVAVGKVAFNLASVDKIAQAGHQAILVCDYLDPNNITSFEKLAGLVAAEGGAASHMALVLQALGKPGVLGIKKAKLKVKEGDWISIDANTGEIFQGQIPLKPQPQLPKNLRKFIEARTRFLGDSPWTAALYKTLKPYQREDFLAKIKNITPEIEKWQSEKAQTTTILNALWSEDDMIRGQAVDPRNTSKLTKAFLKVFQQPERQNIPRSGHNPEKLSGAPWATIATKQDIEDFETNPDFPGGGKYGGLPRWQEDPTLEAILVAAEPQGKMDPSLAKEHFVFTISCPLIWPPKITIDLALQTAHLRSFENVLPENLIQIMVPLNPEAADNLGDIEFKFGKNYQNDSYATAVANLVAKTVFGKWWQPPFTLPQLMSALDQSYGLSVLEGQGRMKNQKESLWGPWIYGAKGREEKAKLKKK